MNLSDLREAIRAKTGYPERGETGTKRLNIVINQALRRLWGEIPESLLREEYRFDLEPTVEIKFYFDKKDDRCLLVDRASYETAGGDSISPFDSLYSNTAVGGQNIYSGRWIEWEYKGKVYSRQIARVTNQSVYEDADVKIFKKCWGIILTEPVYIGEFGKGLGGVMGDAPRNIPEKDALMTGTIFTKEYPYDADIQSIKRVTLDPKGSRKQIPASRFSSELDSIKLNDGWRTEGEISSYARGSYYQLEAPHYFPNVKKLTASDEVFDVGLPLGKYAMDGVEAYWWEDHVMPVRAPTAWGWMRNQETGALTQEAFTSLNIL